MSARLNYRSRLSDFQTSGLSDFRLLLLPVLFFVSCQKETGSGENETFHVSFKVNGVDKTYTGHTFAHLADLGGGNFEFQVLGATTATSYNDYLGIYINNSPGGGAIQAGEYRDNSTTRVVLTTYQNGGNEYEAGQTVAQEAVIHNVTIASHFKVIITTLTPGDVARGTFSGDYYLDGDPTKQKISITNGDFYVKFQ